jgi:transcriptional regulator with XRE-family HTH domain
MIDTYKVGNQIALLRKAKGLTGEKFAELLMVSPQAVSKWENGKCLPEAAILPSLAQILGTSIDSLLMPQELVVLNATFTDGSTAYDVTRILSNNINGNKLYMAVSPQFMGITMDSDRLKLLNVTYQTPEGIFYEFKLENEFLDLNLTKKGIQYKKQMEIVGAFYGNKEDYRDCFVKMKHYDYFNWGEIYVNHESFPSSPKSDDTEYLTLVYINEHGIQVISCPENETLCYGKSRSEFYLKDMSTCILPGIKPLEWESGMDCTWAGAVLRATTYMGENYTYEQIMGMSGACYRIAFTPVWDWSAVDALVAFDYSSILFHAIGYEAIWGARLDKENRNEERQRIVSDIRNGKPVIAINLRIAPEWGVITGFQETGKVLLCRTYFDKQFLNENNDYLESDFWPFLITHFGEKLEKPTDYEILITSLKTLIKSFQAPCERGYYQGKEAYEQWIHGLLDEKLWDKNNSMEDIDRRIGVNDALLLNIIDARRCAMEYLKSSTDILTQTSQNELHTIVDKYSDIVNSLMIFRNDSKQNNSEIVHYNEIDTARNYNQDFRNRQVTLLQEVLQKESDIVQLVENLLETIED